MFNKIRLIWSPKKSPVLIKDSHSSALIRRLFREGACQVVDVRGHVWSLKAIILTVTRFQRGPKLSAQYFGHYAKLAGCVAVISFRHNGRNLGAFKLQKPSIRTFNFQNGLLIEERDKPRWFEKEVTGPDAVFGFGSEHLRWFFSPLEPPPAICATGSFRSNLVPIKSKKLPEKNLVFVSQWRAAKDRIYYESERLLLPFLSIWCRSRKVELIVLGASVEEPEQERAFFESVIEPGTFRFSPKANNWWECYLMIDRADLVVSVDSTLGVEAILRGKKTCFFSGGLSGRKFYKFLLEHENGPFWVLNGSVEKFSGTLSQIHSLSEAEYLDFVGDTSWLGSPDPGLFETRKCLVEICPQLHEVVQHLSLPVMAEELPSKI